MNAKITGCGGYLPEKVLTNSDLEKIVDTSDEWITTRTGIKQRHIAADNQVTSDLAVEAAKIALKNSGKTIEDIDGIIVATTTPDRTFPSTAVYTQAKLGIKHGFAFDVQAVCSGFVYSLGIANGMIKTGQAKNLLVIGAEKMSSVINWEDRSTCVLFGDGAGAIVLSATEEENKGILSTALHSDGSYADLLHTDGGTALNQKAGFIHMEGPKIMKHATGKMSGAILEALEKLNLTSNNVDWLVPHQANLRILAAVAKKLNIPEERVITTVMDHANTSAASIPLALYEGVKSGKIKEGDLLAMEALGGGLTWASAVIRM